MCQDFGPLFASQLDAIRSYEDNYFGGKIKSRSIQKFDTQVGPTCGLVAVRVAASALKLESIPTVNELLAFCQKHKYTKNGECFSGLHSNNSCQIKQRFQLIGYVKQYSILFVM